jgi:AbiU2
MEQRIAKIEAHTEQLRHLLIGAHTVLAILRPMNIDEELVARLSRQNRGAGFGTIRHVQYWNLVQELVKIVADDDCRVPSIHNLRRHLEDVRIKSAFQKKCSAWGSPAKESDTPEVKEFWKLRDLQHEQEGRQMFDALYDKAMKESAELLNSTALASMKKIRDKHLAHNELKFQNGSYRFIDIQSYGLKYGDEKVLLEKARQVFDDFSALVNRASFEWDRFKATTERDAKLFWEE